MSEPFHPFKFGDQVIADGNKDLPMIVTGFCYRPGGAEVECGYWLNGDYKSIWLALWRLSEALAS